MPINIIIKLISITSDLLAQFVNKYLQKNWLELIQKELDTLERLK